MKKTITLYVMLLFLGLSSFLNAQTTLLSEGFEGTTQFSFFDGDGDGYTWAVNNTAGLSHTGSNCIAVHWDSVGNNDYLISPFISLPAGTTISYSFYAKSADVSYLESFDIKVSTDGINYTNITSETNISGSYTQFSYNLSSYAGQSIKIAIVCVSVNEYYLVVDDILCTSTGSVTLPTVITTNVSSITSSSAMSGGNVTSDGGAAVTARGIIYSTCINPIINPSLNGTGTGIFVSNLSGLSPNNTYHIRAFATNSVGTAYGNEITFTSNWSVPSGPLDVTFGNTGIITTDFCYVDAHAKAMVIQSDGKIVVTGSNKIVRYNSDGTLDNNFDNDGIQNSYAVGNAVGLQSDGKIVVAGDGITVDRFNSNGTADATFGTNGTLNTNIPNSISRSANALAIQSDGKILVAGSVSYSSNQPYFAIIRYNSNGTLDNTFGTGGIVTDTLAIALGSGDIIYALALQTDGKIIAAGVSAQTYGDNIAIERYNTNGTLDNTFGISGVVLINAGGYPFNHQSRGYALALQPDGKIVVGGMTYSQFAATRCNTNGTLDNTFGTGGSVITSVSSSSSIANIAYAVKIQSDLKIILAGYVENNLYFPDMALIRYNPNGTLDNTFGVSGIVKTPVCNNYDGVNAMALQTDGKIITAGYSVGALTSDDVFTLVRYDNNLVTATNSFLQEDNFTLFPNPTSNYFNIVGNELSEIKIFDISGKLIESKKLNNVNDIKIDCSNIEQGIYIISITDNKSNITNKKLIIK